MTSTPRLRSTLLAPALLLAFAVPAEAQHKTTNPTLTTEAFVQPPGHIADVVLAPRYLNVTLGNPSPDGRFFVQQQGDGPPSMATFAKPFYRLGGEQIDWQANRSRLLTEHLLTQEGQNYRREILLEHSGFDFERWME